MATKREIGANGDVLMHYGVLGMKWGRRKDGRPQGFQYGKKAKKAIGIAAGVGAVALATTVLRRSGSTPVSNITTTISGEGFNVRATAFGAKVVDDLLKSRRM